MPVITVLHNGLLRCAVAVRFITHLSENLEININI